MKVLHGAGSPPRGAVRSGVRGLGGGEGAGELVAGADVELAVGVGEVDLDGLRGDEELLGDLAVGHRLGGHAGDATLAGGQGLDSAEGLAAGSDAGGAELLAGPVGEGVGA